MPDSKRKKITIYDVAKYAGVSPGTVSRTLNQIGYIKEDTRDKVLQAVDDFQYIPNVAGRTLKTTKTRMICLAIPDTSNPIYFRMIEATLEVAKRNKYSVLLFYTNGQEEEELKAIRILQESTVDALFLVHFSYSKQLREMVSRCVQPIVLCGMCSHLWLYDGIERNFDTISIRVYDAVYSATSYLISKGYKKIAYLAGKRGIEVYRQRYEAYRQALSDGGIPYNDDLVYWNSYDESGGYAGGKHFFSKGIFPEALCASNDLQMIGFYRACQECPKEQARHIEFVGVDNLEISELLNFSSVDIHEAEVGKNATELLFLRMNEGFEKLPPQDVFINPKLVIRNQKVF